MKLIFYFINISLVLCHPKNVEDFISGTQAFSASVYNKIGSENKNVLVSPFSAETVLALAQSGAEEETGEEIRTALHLPNSKEETESTFKTFLSTFNSNDYVLKTANKIYVQQNFPVVQSFKTVAQDIYQAQLENIEFIQNIAAANTINDWVKEQTNNKIENLVQPQDLGEHTKVLLLNALYFQANWSTSFEAKETKLKNFYKSSEDVVQTKMMLLKSVRCNYYEDIDLGAKMVELDFEGQGASMIFVLPNDIEGLSKIEMNMDSIFAGFRQFSTQTVQVSIPKFKIESTIDFNAVLQQLGVSKAFDHSEADFSGIAGEKGDLALGKVIQKTFIDVNEDGVEAAAATGGSIIIKPSPPPPPAAKVFIADHPFMFFLKVNDVVLFEGRVLQP